jgi:hypothetical protein
MNDLLVPLKNVGVVLKNIHALVGTMARKHTQNIFEKPELALEEEEAPLLWVERGGAASEEERCAGGWEPWEEQGEEAHVPHPCRTSL